MNNAEWNITSLTPDISSGTIYKHFSKRLKDLKVADIWLPHHADRLDVSNEIAVKVGLLEKKTLFMYGSGSYHHLAYGLCRLASELSHGMAYIHIDHHNDSHLSSLGRIDCGSFVQHIVKSGYAKCSLLIGSSHSSALGFTDEFAMYKTNMQSLEEILGMSKNKDAYLSIDLDVMKWNEASTSYSHGQMDKEMLLDAIRVIKSRKNIICADILGYTFSFFQKKKSMQLYEDIAKAIIGEDEWKLHLK